MLVKLYINFYEMEASVTLKDVLYVIYSVSESDFGRRVVAYVCLRVINICDSHKF